MPLISLTRTTISRHGYCQLCTVITEDRDEEVNILKIGNAQFSVLTKLCDKHLELLKEVLNLEAVNG